LTIGFSFVLHIVGIISASLAIFNLLPVIPLDGGHLFLIGLEKLRGRALSLKTDQFIANAGFTLIIMLALFVFYSDFERIGLIDKIREVSMSNFEFNEIKARIHHYFNSKTDFLRLKDTMQEDQLRAFVDSAINKLCEETKLTSL